MRASTEVRSSKAGAERRFAWVPGPSGYGLGRNAAVLAFMFSFASIIPVTLIAVEILAPGAFATILTEQPVLFAFAAAIMLATATGVMALLGDLRTRRQRRRNAELCLRVETSLDEAQAALLALRHAEKRDVQPADLEQSAALDVVVNQLRQLAIDRYLGSSWAAGRALAEGRFAERGEVAPS